MKRQKGMISRKEQITAFFNQLGLATIGTLEDFYHADIEFEDPLVAICGIQALREHFEALYAKVEEVRFEFIDFLQEEDKLASYWRMYYRCPQLKRGKELSIAGSSLLRFDAESGLCIYHKDFFDLDALLYSNLPVLGWILSKAKQALL